MATEHSAEKAKTGWPVACWIGWILTVLVTALFTFSAVMKIREHPQVVEGFAKMGLPAGQHVQLGVVELACAVLYFVPLTSVLGAILLTGYLGGAICTHWRLGEPIYTHIVIGVAIWLALFLRERRLRRLIPFWIHD